MPNRSSLEDRLAGQLAGADGIPEPVTQFRPFPPGGRRWKFDFAWPDQRLVVEVDGGTHTGGAHTRGARIDEDAEKRATTVAAGWRVMVVTGALVRSGAAVELIRMALAWEPAAV